MYISKSIIAGALIVGAIAFGWLVHGVADIVTGAPASATILATPASSVSAPPPAPPSIHLTIMNGPEPVADEQVAPAPVEHALPAPPTTDRKTGATGSDETPDRPDRREGPPKTAQATNTGTNPPGTANSGPTVAFVTYQDYIIASDGSILVVGDDALLYGNTGDVSTSGTVALDVDDSTLTSGPSTVTGTSGAAMASIASGATAPSGSSGPTTASGSGGATTANGTSGTDGTTSLATAEGSVRTGSSTTAPASGTPTASLVEIPQDASPLVSAFILYTANRTADIAGYEDHSILTRGDGNVVTYDDSNVLINRDGKINANTGDTDSAGLNAIATLRSTVTAGPHCDDGCDDESIIQAEAGVFDEGDVAIDGNGNVVWAPDAADESPNDDDSEDDSLPGDNGDDTDAADDESDDGDVSDPAEPPETRPDADNGEEPDREYPAGSLIVGGDGIDDLSERVDGNFNVSTYDDSNVIIGGTGDVNAQIGDSDTGGTVTMDTIDSIVSGGNSR